MKNTKNSLPFSEEKNGLFYERIFSGDITESELKWHFDLEDRIVVCEHETDWLLQMDNKLPVKIEKGLEYFIQEGEYHRIIKGTGDLKVKVLKLT